MYNEGREYPHIYGQLNLEAGIVEENEQKRMNRN
ncbi:hypothetical protein [Paenibacillus xylanexedens]